MVASSFVFFGKTGDNPLVKLSAVIIAKNEETKIARAIASVQWADEVLVVDSGSSDGTVEVAESLGAKVLRQEWLGFSKQKQFAVDSAANDLILSIDADEVVTDELREEIRAMITSSVRFAGYTIPRLSIYMSREIRHSGWYPDRQLRLFDRRFGRWSDVLVHESFKLESGETGKLSGHLLHFSVDDAIHHHQMIGERYAPLAARQAFDRGRRTGPFAIATAGAAAFVRSYVLKLGFLDGLAGFAIARFAAHHAFLKHLLIYEIQQLDERTPDNQN